MIDIFNVKDILPALKDFEIYKDVMTPTERVLIRKTIRENIAMCSSKIDPAEKDEIYALATKHGIV